MPAQELAFSGSGFSEFGRLPKIQIFSEKFGFLIFVYASRRLTSKAFCVCALFELDLKQVLRCLIKAAPLYLDGCPLLSL